VGGGGGAAGHMPKVVGRGGPNIGKRRSWGEHLRGPKGGGENWGGGPAKGGEGVSWKVGSGGGGFEMGGHYGLIWPGTARRPENMGNKFIWEKLDIVKRGGGGQTKKVTPFSSGGDWGGTGARNRGGGGGGAFGPGPGAPGHLTEKKKKNFFEMWLGGGGAPPNGFFFKLTFPCCPLLLGAKGEQALAGKTIF